MPISLNVFSIKQEQLSANVSQALDKSFLTGVLCILIFLFLNPFLAIFAIALISFILKVPKLTYVLFASIGFALFFYARDYGVAWGDSTDDIPNYIIYFHSDNTLSIVDLFTRFFLFPSGTEPLWHMICWILINVFHASDNTFLFTYYLILFVCLFSFFILVSEKYFMLFAIIYVFLTPASLDAIFHIWRQELALLVYLIGIALHFVRKRKLGLILIYLTPFIHLSFLYFVIIFAIYSAVKNKKITNTKLKYVGFLIMFSILVSLLYFTGIKLISSAGIGAIDDYFGGSGDSRLRMFIVVVIYSIVLLSSFFLLETDDLNKFFLILFFPILGIMFSFPGSNSIYDRLFIAVLPMLGVYLFRSYLMNFSKKYLPALMFFIFLSGTIRLYLPFSAKISCIQFLAHGHFLDPTMGIIKVLYNL